MRFFIGLIIKLVIISIILFQIDSDQFSDSVIKSSSDSYIIQKKILESDLKFHQSTPRMYFDSVKNNSRVYEYRGDRSVQGDVFLFDKYKYSLSNKYLIKNKIERREMLNFNSVDLDDVSFSDIDDNIQLEIEPSKVSVILNEPLEFILELVNFIRDIIGLSDGVKILLKGSADRSISKWNRALLPEPHFYSSITYRPYNKMYTNADFQFVYSDQLTSLELDSIYTNYDLPLLRSEYIKNELVVPILKTYNINNKVKVEILEGDVFNDISHAQARATKVYLEILF